MKTCLRFFALSFLSQRKRKVIGAMSNQSIDISFILNSSEFVGNALTSTQANVTLSQATESNASTKTSETTGESTIEDDRKRERNILSSRKYRAKRRERMKMLEDTNNHLALQIKYTSEEIDEMKRKIHKFVRHAASCEECGNLQIRFE